jgi:peptidoglycan L-alanyl-D-glutamate endopeptidase CwlK
MNAQEISEDFIKNVYFSRDLRLADPRFLIVWPKLKEELGLETGYSFEISCVYRSLKAQNDLFQIGRTKPGKVVTNCDGQKDVSNHNVCPSLAIDVYAHRAGKAIWDVELYKPLGVLAPKYGLSWGGSWAKFKDYPHLEFAGTK